MATAKKDDPTPPALPESDELFEGNPYELFETDPTLEKDGVWLDFGTFRLKCAAAGEANPEFLKCYGDKIADIRAALNQGLIPNGSEVETRFLAEAYAETVIKDADGNFNDRDGNPIPKTVEGYTGVLMDLPRLFQIVRRRTLAMETFKLERAEKVGNG